MWRKFLVAAMLTVVLLVAVTITITTADDARRDRLQFEGELVQGVRVYSYHPSPGALSNNGCLIVLSLAGSVAVSCDF